MTSPNGIRKPSARIAGSYKTKIIEVTVGNQREPFLIHKNILCASLPFFRKACNGEWKESREGWVDLPENKPEYFEIYVLWLYSRTVFADEQKDKTSIDWDVFLGVYLLGDKLLDNDFKNDLLDIVMSRAGEASTRVKLGNLPTAHAKEIYQLLPASDLYRRLYVDLWAFKATESWFESTTGDMEDAPIEFFRDVARNSPSARLTTLGRRGPLGQEVDVFTTIIQKARLSAPEDTAMEDTCAMGQFASGMSFKFGTTAEITLL